VNTSEPRYRLRMRTVVLGLIALAVSASVLLSTWGSVDVPPRAVALAVLIGAGVLLLGNGIATAVREQRQRVTDDPRA